MTKYEELEQIAYDQDIIIHENCDFANETSDTPVKGLFLDGHIFLASGLTSADKTCVLAEELGHHFTSAGNIVDQHIVANRQQEQVARLWAYNRLIGLEGIVSAYQAGCRNRYELAEHLGVTEPFLMEALEKYRSIYGVSARIEGYTVIFEPALAVMTSITNVRKPEPKKAESAKIEKPAAAPVEAATRARKPIEVELSRGTKAAMTRAYNRQLKAAARLGMDYDDYVLAVHDRELMKGY